MIPGPRRQRGPMLPMLVITGLALLGLWALLTYLLASGMGEFRHAYARLRLPGGEEVWLEFKGSHLRTAPTATALDQASWVGAQVVGWERTQFPPLDLPLELKAAHGIWQGQQVRLTVIGGNHVEMAWHLVGEDRAGGRWECQATADLEASGSPQEAPVNELGTLAKPTLEVHAEATTGDGGPSVAAALSLVAGAEGALEVEHLTRNGRPVDVRVQVLDSSGNKVASKSGPLEDFGYT